MKAKTLIIILLALALCIAGLSGCGADNNGAAGNDGTAGGNGTVDDSGAGGNGGSDAGGQTSGSTGYNSRVAGADSQRIYGYIREINRQARTVTVDRVELTNDREQSTMYEEGVGNQLYRPFGGYYVYNQTTSRVMYAIADQVSFDLQGLGNSAGGAGQAAGNNGNAANNGMNGSAGLGNGDVGGLGSSTTGAGAGSALDNTDSAGGQAGSGYGGNYTELEGSRYARGYWYDEDYDSSVYSIDANMNGDDDVLYLLTLVNNKVTDVTRVTESNAGSYYQQTSSANSAY